MAQWLTIIIYLLFLIGIPLIIIFSCKGKSRKRWKKRALRVLFIGNSHTYHNDLPGLFREIAKGSRRNVEVTMIAHSDWYLRQHLEDRSQEAVLNIKNGGYDYVVLQEHAHPFEDESVYLNTVKKFSWIITEACAIPVIYAVWAKKDDPWREDEMELVQRKAAGEISALYAPVGQQWWKKMNFENADFYEQDGCHANIEGTALASKILWDVIRNDSISDERWRWYRKCRRAYEKKR